MKAKLALVELDHHVEVLDGLLDLLDPAEFAVSVYTLDRIAEELATRPYAQNFRWHTCTTGREKAFIAASTSAWATADLVFLSTLESQFAAWYRYARRHPNLVVRIHNAHTYLHPWRHLHWPRQVQALWKNLSYGLRRVILRGEWHYRSTLLQHCRGICFSDENMARFQEADVKVFPTLPLAHYQEQGQAPLGVELHLAVVGNLEKRRKNLDEAREIIRAYAQNPPLPLRVSLLGKPKGRYGKKIQARFADDAQALNYRLQTWSTRIPQKEFLEQLATVHLLLSPIQQYTRYFWWRERYGVSKISGSINDAIRYGIPNLIPQHYPPPRQGDGLFAAYGHSAEACRIIENFVRGEWPDEEALRQSLEYYGRPAAMARTRKAFTAMLNP